MAYITLHHNNPAEVASGKTLDVPLEESLHLFMFTGLAQAKTARDNTDFPPNEDVVTIKLGQTASQPPQDGEWSATVGLSSVINGDSDLIFATNSVDLQRDATSELQLVVETAALGEGTAVNSFSYQATVLLRVPEVELAELLVGPVFGDSSDVSVPSGYEWAYRVGLTGPAPGGGLLVSLTSALPAIAPVSDGASSVHLVVVQPGETFSDNLMAPATARVDVTTPVIITAAHNGVLKTATVTVEASAH
jgi:hypothetical protein